MVRLGDQFSLKFNLKFTIFFPFFYHHRITSRAAKRSERGVPPKFTDFARLWRSPLAAAPAPAVAWRGGARIFGAFSTVRASGQPLCCPFRASASERNSEHANRRLNPVRAIR